MILQLDDNEVQFILNVLGELPSKTGAFMLMQKIKLQANSPIPSNDPADKKREPDTATIAPDLELADGVNA